jgi:hypothetical protein
MSSVKITSALQNVQALVDLMGFAKRQGRFNFRVHICLHRLRLFRTCIMAILVVGFSREGYKLERFLFKNQQQSNEVIEF